VKIKLLSYNIRYGGVGREDLIGKVIRSVGPDIVVLQEATQPEVVERFALVAGMKYWRSMRGESVACLSQVELHRCHWHRPHGVRRAFLQIEPAGLAANIFGVHLSALHSNWTERRRVRELRALIALLENAKDGMNILAGDFNALAPGEELDIGKLPMRLRPLVWLSGGRVRWQVVQLMLDTLYTDAFRYLNPNDPGFTFPTWDPHLRLDYVFVQENRRDCLSSASVIREEPAAVASDHFPLLVEFEVPQG
jgi:endonuclease/exonuclease/phosphatase family metal-dependent hydrolase